MGQRLSINIMDGGNILANAYYHWSAYTRSSLALTEAIRDFIDENENEFKNEDPVLFAIRALESTGAGLSETDTEDISDEDSISNLSSYGEAQKLFLGENFEPSFNRNDGLIEITEKGTSETQMWAEGVVNIDLFRRTISFDVYWGNDIDEYLACEGFHNCKNKDESVNEALGKIFHSDLPIDLYDINFDDFDSFKEVLDEHDLVIFDKYDDNYVIEVIE